MARSSRRTAFMIAQHAADQPVGLTPGDRTSASRRFMSRAASGFRIVCASRAISAKRGIMFSGIPLKSMSPLMIVPLPLQRDKFTTRARAREITGKGKIRKKLIYTFDVKHVCHVFPRFAGFRQIEASKKVRFRQT
jgi:hypothetical protein